MVMIPRRRIAKTNLPPDLPKTTSQGQTHHWIIFGTGRSATPGAEAVPGALGVSLPIILLLHSTFLPLLRRPR